MMRREEKVEVELKSCENIEKVNTTHKREQRRQFGGEPKEWMEDLLILTRKSIKRRES